MQASQLVQRHQRAELTSSTVKKIRLRTAGSDSRIFREVNALSRLSHRFIVRYYTTWIEMSEPLSRTASDTSDSETGTEEGMTSVPQSKDLTGDSNDGISFRLEDLDDYESVSKSSFPSIHFTRSSSPKTDEDDESDEAIGNFFYPSTPREFQPSTPPQLSRTLYIQMVGEPASRAV
jgi:translation initiation factor 2-alpha kinase 4